MVCPIHGDFWIRPNDLVNNHGCSTCGGIRANKIRIANEKNTVLENGKTAFDERYKKIHSTRKRKNNYVSASKKRIITMKLNNSFDTWRENWYNSMIENGKFQNPAHLKQYKKFKRKVYRHTRKNLERCGDYVGYYPSIYKCEGRVIDHKYSVKEGFINQVPISVLSHVCNVELISVSENAKKGAICSITMEELIERIQNFNELDPLG